VSHRSEQRVTKSEAVAVNGMVTAMHPLAAEAGVEILKRGGNAADAAIATALAVGVVEPFMSGLGGAAYALAYDSGKGETRAFDGSAVAPIEAREDMFELAGNDTAPLGVYGWRATRGDAAETGFRSIAVPGALAALDELHRAMATLSWEELAGPAVRLAEEGFPVDEYLFVHSASSKARLRPFPATLDVFFDPDGNARVPNLAGGESERITQRALAATLRSLGTDGPRSFYEGRLAEETVAHVRANGGVLSLEDLASYRPIVSPPARMEYRGRRIDYLPGPSGGPTVALALNVLEGFDLPSLPHDDVERVHLVAEAMRLAFQDRFRFLADPALEDVPIEGLVSKSYASDRRALLSPLARRTELPEGNPWAHTPTGRRAPRPGSGDARDQHTTHLNVADRQGNLVALTATLGARFGSGVTVPASGVVLNNGMMWFDPEPGRLSSIRPRKRALHAAAPVLVFRNDRPVGAMGAPGARKILSAVLQVVLATVDHDMGIQDAIEAPRIHVEVAPPLLVESTFPHRLAEGLRALGHTVSIRREGLLVSCFGRPSGIAVDARGGCFRGGVEPHRPSLALGY
jgi:gamma-glutamyltranspeptidase / glutathione hydrolase